MKKITTFLLAFAFVAFGSSATVTINVRTSTGGAPYLYVWNGAGLQLNGEWPGTLMNEAQTYTTPDGLVWFTQSFEDDAINIIFNDGDDPAIQTSNIMGVTGTGFFLFDPEEGEYEDVTGTYITPTDFDVNTLPARVVYIEGKEFAYFIAPTNWTNCNVWAWNSITGTNFTNSKIWPGDPITLVGNTTDGNPVYQWIGPDIVEGDSPTGIIFNTGSTQTGDLDYVAGGVYNLAGKLLYTLEPSEVPLLGDVDNDGTVTSADITILYNYLVDGNADYMIFGDQDHDGEITAGDIVIVYNILLGNSW